MNNPRAPRPARWFLQRCLPPKDREFLVGDYEALYIEYLTHGSKLAADLWYWKQCLKTIPRFLIHRVLWRLDMFRNYLVMCYRQFMKHKIYSVINILGLTLGLTACLLIFIWVADELSYDRFHENADRIYRIIQETHTADQVTARPHVSCLLEPALRDELPEIESSFTATMISGFWTVKSGDELIEDVHIVLTTPEFLTMLDFPIKGDPASVLSDKFNAVITEAMANRVFGSDDPVGKILEINRNDYQVVGVMNDVPHNSHIQFDCVIPAAPLVSHPALASWDYNGFACFLQMTDAINTDDFNGKMTGILKNHRPEFEGRLYLQPLKRIHLNSTHHQYDYAERGEYRYVLIFSALSVFILVIASINFMNLATARAAGRAKEVGMRKVMGADRKMLIHQFYSESILMTLFSLMLALFLVSLFIPVLNQLTGKLFTLQGELILRLVIGALVFALFTGIAAGSYPAVVLSAFKPSSVLRRVFHSGRKKTIFRRTLVVFQFSLSIFLIIATAMIHLQLHHMRNADLGYDRENLLILGVQGGFYSHFESYKQEFLKHPNIVSVARGFQPIWDRIQTATPRWQGQQPGEETAMQCYGAGYDYFKTWGMELIEGRSFSKAFSTDSSNYLINQTAARIIGLETPVGKQLTVDGVTGEIIGIVKDFHHTSLHNTIQPIIFRVFNAAGMAIKVRSMDEGTLDYIESIWNKAVPNEPFENDYFALKVDAFYEKEEKLATLFNIFTFLAIFISCLGLLGLASFIAESRTKEIGIRKVLGAPVFNLVVSLSKEFVLLVAIAIVIAWPVGWWLMNRWLQNFAYRMHHSLLIYVIAAMFAFCMAVMTVSFQAFRAAGANPVKTLRYE